MGLGFAASGTSWRETESWDVFRDGGPTKSEGAGSRLGLVFAVGEGFTDLLDCEAEDMAECVLLHGNARNGVCDCEATCT